MIMLDERTAVLLKILNNKCSQGSYKVISVDELILDFPPRYGADKDLIGQMVTTLSQKGYLSLRYDRDGEFCLSLTPKGRLFSETDQTDGKHNQKTWIIDLLPHFFDFLSRFLSIFLAIFLAVILLKLTGVLC